MKKYKTKYIQHFDDERQIGNGIIVTLHYGWSYEPNEHQGVRGFDKITEAISASRHKNIYPCKCELCLRNLRQKGNKINEKLQKTIKEHYLTPELIKLRDIVSCIVVMCYLPKKKEYVVWFYNESSGFFLGCYYQSRDAAEIKFEERISC